MSTHGYYLSAGAHEGQRHPIPMELELQSVMSHLTWVLRTRLRLSA